MNNNTLAEMGQVIAFPGAYHEDAERYDAFEDSGHLVAAVAGGIAAARRNDIGPVLYRTRQVIGLDGQEYDEVVSFRPPARY